MDATILLLVVKDGVVNGAVYALLAIAIVLVFSVTRVIFIPQGEFVAFGALTLAALSRGEVPGTAPLLVTLSAVSLIGEVIRHRSRLSGRRWVWLLARDVVLPFFLWALTAIVVDLHAGLWVTIPLTLLLMISIGPVLYRTVFAPLAEASVLVLLIAAAGVHLTLLGIGLQVFGPEGVRAPGMFKGMQHFGPVTLTSQKTVLLVVTIAVMGLLWFGLQHSMIGKSLRAAAVNRIGARLVGLPVSSSGQLAFAIAAAIGAVTGILIGSYTTIYYDTGFLIGLTGFVAAILGGLVSYPATVIASLFVGLIEAFSAFEASTYKEVIVFLSIIPVLFVRSLRRRVIEDHE
jgi:branched-chain amino acid transport system permease protein